MAGGLQSRSGDWSSTLPYGQNKSGFGFPEYKDEPGGKLGPFVGTEHIPDAYGVTPQEPEPFSPEWCKGRWFDTQCWFSRGGPLDTGKIAGDVGKGAVDAVGGAISGVVGPWLTKGALLGLAAIMIVLGLWAILRNGPVGQGFREGIKAARG